MLLITAETLPSFHKSPTAKPREEDGVVIADPAAAEMSLKVPSPLLWKRMRGSL